MSLRVPVQSMDARVRRDEDSTLISATAQRNVRPNQHDGSITPVDVDTNPPALVETPPSPASQRRHVAIPDPVAFKYLEEDRSVTVVERKEQLQGYELYLVEQWACSRQSPTLVIATYTGDENHSVAVGVLSVPADGKAWSPRLRIYFKAIQQYHARPKGTPLGELMVTNLSSFPSALTVIPVPDGDIRKHRRIFIVNEDLKRLGCSGRSGMTLSEPTGAAKAKFYQLYKIDDKVPFTDAVVELVKLCQVALSLFGNLDQVYIDGLLCDVTETAVGDWWTEFGAEYYNVEPTDGILGPTTVVALLGLLMGARNRLSYFGAPVLKDVFDIDATERGISYFQKYHKLDRTKRLDLKTMRKLHTATAKAAAGEGWGVQKAVKSTVSEIGGKRGDIVLGMVGGRDKGGIGDIETIDLDRFISLASGERAKWLWYGKPKRAAAASDQERSLPDMGVLFGKEDLGAQAKRTNSTAVEDEPEVVRRDEPPTVYSGPAPGSAVSVAEGPGDRDAMRRGVFKSVARDARSGLGRIKDAMTSGSGLRGHASRPSRDESSDTAFSGQLSSVPSNYSAGVLPSPSPGPGPVPGQLNRAFTWKNKPEEYLNSLRDKSVESATPSVTASAPDEALSAQSLSTPRANGTVQKPNNGDRKRISQNLDVLKEADVGESPAGSTVGESDVQQRVLGVEQRINSAFLGLYRRHSISGIRPAGRAAPSEARWPRRLSFGDAEEAILRWVEIMDMADSDDSDNEAMFQKQALFAETAKILYMGIANMKERIEPWVDENIKSIEDMDDNYARQQDELQTLYHHCRDVYQRMKQDSQDTVGEERVQITEALKEVEVLAAKLEYEINVLVSRVQDVEDGVVQFEVQVDDVERRADDLKAHLEKESWLHWAVRTLTGIGTGPNITRPRQHEHDSEDKSE
ncbi:Uu.00g027550.m01.CDS01 [Anthostomella pinea]|uniref:Uu.00g027550.m01.CDS01 n=1 Tax=Anthostomella pinea TaxID=933095 RepID=A0AAI8V8B6_9PEZI|nr:Uu.00g027550.m01.CDS01 [Anthostomella pinea]